MCLLKKKEGGRLLEDLRYLKNYFKFGKISRNKLSQMVNFERIWRDKLSRTRPPFAKFAKVSTNKVDIF